MPVLRTALAALLGAAAATAFVGCTQVTGGTPRAADRSQDSALSALLVDDARVTAVMGATDMQTSDTYTTMTDSSDELDDTTCLGAFYNAQETVYDGTGWTDVVDRTVEDPGDEDYGHWVQQTVVRFESQSQAKKFFETAKQQWLSCTGEVVNLDYDDGETYRWRFEGIEFDGDSVAQSSRQLDDIDWECQHAMNLVADLVVEVSACTTDIEDEAAQLADQIADNAR